MTIYPTTLIYYKQNPNIKLSSLNGILIIYGLNDSSDAVCRKVHLYFQQNKQSYIESTFNISYKYFKHLYLNSYLKV